MQRSQWRQSVVLLAACAVAACKDGGSIAPNTEGIAGVRSGLAQDAVTETAGEDLFVELSKIAPSSAGFAYEGTRLVVYVADEAERGVAEAFVAKAVQQRRILPPGGGRRIEAITGRKVRYSYRTLAAYRSQVDNLLLGKDRELQFIDLDELRNSVTLGYSGDSGSVIARVKQALSIGQVDGELLRVERVLGARTDATPVAATPMMVPGNLTWAANPVVGGVMIYRLLAQGAKQCTLGFTAKRDGETGFVTNSHCTEDMYGMGGIYKTFAQPSTVIGTETVDPYGYTCGVAPPTECRGSDAAFIQSNNAVPFRVGYIAKPASRGTGDLSMSSNDDHIRIAQTGTAVAGMMVEKIGSVSGWTYGGVTHTCVTAMIQEDQWFKRVACADKGLYGGQGGDSGGPVWVWLPYSPSEGGVQAGLLGIHSSSEIEGNSKYFSRIDRIMSDLGGSWEVLGPVPPSPLQAFIWGWTDVKVSTTCQLVYSAHATGGDGNYTFSAMTTDGTVVSSSGDALTLTFPTSGPHWVAVTVTDGTGAQSTANVGVQAESSNYACYGSPPGSPF